MSYRSVSIFTDLVEPHSRMEEVEKREKMSRKRKRTFFLKKEGFLYIYDPLAILQIKFNIVLRSC